MLSDLPNDCATPAAPYAGRSTRASIARRTDSRTEKFTGPVPGATSDPIPSEAPHRASGKPVAALPYRPQHQVELRNLHAEVDALLFQLNASRPRGRDLAHR